MSDFALRRSSVDVGQRKFFIRVYNRLAASLLLTGGAAWFASHSFLTPLLFAQHGAKLSMTLLGYGVLFAPLLLILGLAKFADSAKGSAVILFGVAGLFGLSLGSLFLTVPTVTLATVFFATSAAFGALSLVGYTTKRDLSGMGGFLTMALFGLIITMLIGLVIHSTLLSLAVDLVGLLIFAGFVAYDTQKLKEIYEGVRNNEDDVVAAANTGALSIYLDFVNIFLLLLDLFGNNSSNN